MRGGPPPRINGNDGGGGGGGGDCYCCRRKRRSKSCRKILVKGPLARPARGWEDDIKIALKYFVVIWYV